MKKNVEIDTTKVIIGAIHTHTGPRFTGRGAIKVKDRYLSVNEITFDTDKSALVTYFELEFLQETETKTTKTPKMKNLYERVVTESGGTSENTD